MPNFLVPVSREIATLRRSLKAMDRSLRRLGPKLRKVVESPAKSATGRVGRKLKLSTKRRAQLKLQGQYIGYLRNLKPKQKAEVKRLRERRGMEIATARARKLMKKEKAA
jgi:hypothetical protein